MPARHSRCAASQSRDLRLSGARAGRGAAGRAAAGAASCMRAQSRRAPARARLHPARASSGADRPAASATSSRGSASPPSPSAPERRQARRRSSRRRPRRPPASGRVASTMRTRCGLARGDVEIGARTRSKNAASFGFDAVPPAPRPARRALRDLAPAHRKPASGPATGAGCAISANCADRGRDSRRCRRPGRPRSQSVKRSQSTQRPAAQSRADDLRRRGSRAPRNRSAARRSTPTGPLARLEHERAQFLGERRAARFARDERRRCRGRAGAPAASAICVDLPTPSTPSKVMNAAAHGCQRT